MGGKTYYQPRRYWLIKKFTSDDAIEWDVRLVKALNRIGKENPGIDQAGLYFELMDKGVTQTEQAGTDDDAAIDVKLKEISDAKARKSRLAKLYKELGREGFEEFCEQEGIEGQQDFLDEWDRAQQESESWLERAERVMVELLDDGELHHTDECKTFAIECGLLDPELDDYERYWARLRQLASRRGWTTGDYSHWQREPVTL